MIASNSRFSKKQLTITTLELVAAQIVENLANNIGNSFPNYNIGEVYRWSDSTVVLDWLESNESYKQFVHNRAKYISSKTPITFSYVYTIQNLAEIGSRGSNIEGLPKYWLDDPSYLAFSDYWPKKKKITATKESEKKPSW